MTVDYLYYAERLEDVGLLERALTLPGRDQRAVPVGGQRVAGHVLALDAAHAKQWLAVLQERPADFPDPRVRVEPQEPGEPEDYFVDWGEALGPMYAELDWIGLAIEDVEHGTKYGYSHAAIWGFIDRLYGEGSAAFLRERLSAARFNDA